MADTSGDMPLLTVMNFKQLEKVSSCPAIPFHSEVRETVDSVFALTVLHGVYILMTKLDSYTLYDVIYTVRCYPCRCYGKQVVSTPANGTTSHTLVRIEVRGAVVLG